MRNILAVGAYERDNFGDMLFLDVLRLFLPTDNIIPGSVIYSDMRNDYNNITIPYHYVLSNYNVDAIWVVGGEVGSVGIIGALNMSLSDSLLVPYANIGLESTEQQIQAELFLGADRKNNQAYIPNKKNYPLNKQSPLIINSVGLSYAHKNKTSVEALLMASIVTVRENASLEWCDSMGVKAGLAPDSVHALGKLYMPNKKNSGLVFQANEEYIRAIGIETIVNNIKKVYKETDKKVTIIAAGVARNHDNPEALLKLTEKLNKSGIKAVFSLDRKPLGIVDIIAGASIVISTSLHVRIVAATYGKRRVSLENDKVTHYVESWDTLYPYNVKIDSLFEASCKARQVDLETTNELSCKLTELSTKSLVNLSNAVKHNDQQKINVKKLSQNYLENIYKKIFYTIVDNYKKVSRLEFQADALNKDILNLKEQNTLLNNEISQIKNSKAWHYVSMFRKIKSKIKR